MRRGRRRLASAPFSFGLSHQQRVVVDRIAGKLRREFASPQASVHALPPHFFCIPAQRVGHSEGEYFCHRSGVLIGSRAI